MTYLQGKVALVTGASRGIGKGIAIALGEAGATVYITGRGSENSDVGGGIGGSLEETQGEVEKAGGKCIAVNVDHSDDEQVRLLFERIDSEQNGLLDVLVNNVYSGVRALRNAQGKPFWESDLGLWDAGNNVGLRSHYIASVFAARMMSKNQQGLICTISSWGGLSYIFGAAYGAGKAACDRLAADMAVELKSSNITSISLYPGIVGTEHITQVADESTEEDNSSPSSMSSAFKDRYNWETPLLTGRVIAKLANEPNIIKNTGKVHIVAELAQKYGVVDKDGNLPASLRSLRFVIPSAIPGLRKYAQLVPDIRVPWWVLLTQALMSPKIP